jgi:DeoR/GlpR family transcriptional regulator of sugar metabolism
MQANSAKTRILVADSSKVGQTKSVYFASLVDFQTIMTDNSIPDEYAAFIRDLGIELIVV